MHKDRYLLNLERIFQSQNPSREGYREISFKARSIGDNDWWFGSLLRKNDSCELVSPSCFENTLIRIKVDKETICQYTNVRDMNGIPVYEHDIVRHRFHNGIALLIVDSEVVWYDNGFSLYIKESKADCKYYPFYNDPGAWGGKDIRVIGNIYDLSSEERNLFETSSNIVKISR